MCFASSDSPVLGGVGVGGAAGEIVDGGVDADIPPGHVPVPGAACACNFIIGLKSPAKITSIRKYGINLLILFFIFFFLLNPIYFIAR